jgi:hypothetical protein
MRHPAIERVRYGVAPPLTNAERIAEYRQLIDETSDYHHDRVARGQQFIRSTGRRLQPVHSPRRCTGTASQAGDAGHSKDTSHDHH